MEKPRILDLGCGSGVPTLELSRLSQGQIVAVDIDQFQIDLFKEGASSSGSIFLVMQRAD